MEAKITCIVCPIGCQVALEYKGKTIMKIEGNECKKGIQYAKDELFEPKRTLTTTIFVENGELPLVSVRTSQPVPKDRLFDVMDLISEIKVTAPVKSGQILVKRVLGLNTDIIATKTVKVKGC